MQGKQPEWKPTREWPKNLNINKWVALWRAQPIRGYLVGGNVFTGYRAFHRNQNKMATEKYPLYKGKVILEFDPKSHIYSVKGKQVYGVTNITNVLV
jgi:hypothetical protein